MAEASRTWSTEDGVVLRAMLRPDGAWSLRLPDAGPSVWGGLLHRANLELHGPLLVSCPAGHHPEAAATLTDAGFEPIRQEVVWRLSLARLRALPRVHTEHRLLPVTEVDLAEAAALDNRIRHDIPGTESWTASAEEFAATLDDPEFDPALYRVAQHPGSGTLDGLIRVWSRAPEPRLGCLGVTRPWRRTRLALALVQDVARTLESRGVTHLVTETDTTNRGSHRMAARLGGEAMRETVEWRRPA
ncbi:GNAT family N-acetyltransferase [Serinicoccus marinus]|uniref:GNAT family N-acetyltransferase n=1 Tax=Serinicoccus marinus TaxID=247333 RepID=UPI002491E7AF|nr:GNAT family N-acetyltransferase [Serinicoccus marinus]